jgi:LuxR family transcriptional regulator, glucitol operon activator
MANASAVRNTCFALLSSIELDVREMIARELAPSGTEVFLPSDVKTSAAARFAFDHKEPLYSAQPSEVDLLAYMDFGDLAKVLRIVNAGKKEGGDVGFGDIAERLEKFVATRNRVCHSRPLEEEDLPSCLDLGKTLIHEYPTLPWTALGISQRLLSEEPGFVLTLQIPEFWSLDSSSIRHNLPLPDYDETGFLGRSQDRSAVRKHLLAAHPIVTIVGEGGVGKSALAIQCLYDLLDLQNNQPYEAIIWTSLKTKTLTASGVNEIIGSISSTLGVLERVTEELGGATRDKASLEALIQEVLDYLSMFKILLVIDNFETVTDNSLRPLLTAIPVGSKVLLTSRVGLGELEIRYKLDPLDLKTSVSLLRRFSRYLNVQVLLTASDKKLERCCQQLYFNPLLIKWYVQSVSLGSDPEKLISRSNVAFDEVIKYCFENLFVRLSEDERRVLQFLAAARRPLTHTELLFLMQNVNQVDCPNLDRALSTLYSSSMLKRSLVDVKGRERTLQLSLTDVSSEYIARFAPPEKQIFEKLQQASRKLSLQLQLSSVRQAAYNLDLQAVRASTRDQRIAAFHLYAAMEHSKARNFDAARKSIAAAKELLPTFSEVYRISSLIETRAEELYKASQEIEEALQLEPESALIRYEHATFLTNILEDFDKALMECEEAIRLDPKEIAFITLRALILTRLGRYAEAAPLYESVLPDLVSRPKKWRVSTRDQAAECYRRFGEQDRIMRNRDQFRAHINRACEILEEAMATGDYDRSTGRLYSNIIEDAMSLAIRETDEAYGLALFERLSDVSHVLAVTPFVVMTTDKFEVAFGENSRLAVEARGFAGRFERRQLDAPQVGARLGDGRVIGRFVAATDGRQYGFVVDHAGNKYFVIPSFLVDCAWVDLREGTPVQFIPGVDEKGRTRAMQAQIVQLRS